MLELEIHNDSRVAVIHCSGRLVKGDGAERLVPEAMAADKRLIFLDLSGVNAIDAAGLGALAELERRTRAEHRRLRVVNPSPHVREALQVTELAAVLQIVDAAPERARDRAA